MSTIYLERFNIDEERIVKEVQKRVGDTPRKFSLERVWCEERREPEEWKDDWYLECEEQSTTIVEKAECDYECEVEDYRIFCRVSRGGGFCETVSVDAESYARIESAVDRGQQPVAGGRSFRRPVSDGPLLPVEHD